MILVCNMKKLNHNQKVGNLEIEEKKAYFSTGNLINLKSTKVIKLIKKLFTFF